MSRTLEFLSMSRIRRDPAAVEAEVRRRHPGLSEAGVIEVVRGLLFQDPGRPEMLVVHLWGADILTGDPTTIPAWPLATLYWREVILNAGEAKRRAMIDPEGLSTSYVWSKAGNWVQEVSDEDVEVIRQSRARTWFRDVQRFGPFTPHRAFDFPVRDSVAIRSADDLRQFRREQKRTGQWTGR